MECFLVGVLCYKLENGFDFKFDDDEGEVNDIYYEWVEDWDFSSVCEIYFEFNLSNSMVFREFGVRIKFDVWYGGFGRKCF